MPPPPVSCIGGVRTLVDVMRGVRGQPSVQAVACLAIMGLVRGEGELCQANQWALAKVWGGEEGGGV